MRNHIAIDFSKFLYQSSLEGKMILGSDMRSFLKKLKISDSEVAEIINDFHFRNLIRVVKSEMNEHFYTISPELIFSYQDHLEYKLALKNSIEAKYLAIGSILIGAFFALIQTLVNFDYPKKVIESFFIFS